MKRILLLLIFGIGIGLTGWGQQVIGQFPSQDGGFEGQTTGALGTTSSTTSWWLSTSITGNIISTGGRSGPKYVNIYETGSSHRTLRGPAAASIAASTNYTIQFFYKGDKNADGTSDYGDIRGGVSGSTYQYCAYQLNQNQSSWTKYAISTSSNPGASSSGFAVISIVEIAAKVADFDIDDVVIYAGAVDNSAPNTPEGVTVNNATESALDVSWGAATGGVDGGGYVVVRYASDPGTVNDPNQNGIYSVGNTVATGGTVRYIGTGTTFTDNVGLSSGTQYWYKVYTVDKAFNYSVESAGYGTTTSTGSTPPVLTAAVGATVDSPFEITFTEDETWRTAISSITVGGTTLTAGYNTASAGKIIFTPSVSVPAGLLQTSGTKDIVVIATGYTNGTVSQDIGVGADNKLVILTQPTAPASNGAVLANQPVVSIRDQYGNATTSTANVLAAVGAGTWTIGGSLTKAGVIGTATFTDLTATSAATVTGATILFTSGSLTSVTSNGFDIPAPPSPEPTNHPTDFIADIGSPTYSTIDVVWTDATGGTVPTGYLIKGSLTSYVAIVDPVDGTPESDGLLVKNVAAGIETASFPGLDASTTYYFKIYPYTNSGANINYKTDGSVPQASAETAIEPVYTTVNFDDDAKWTAGAAALTSYASDHTYIDGTFSATGGPALRNTTAAQDGFAGALGTYSWRLTNAAASWIITVASGGIGDFAIDIRRWDNTPSPAYTLDYSINGGTDWVNVATIDNTSLGNSSDWKTFYGTINNGVSNVLIRLNTTGTTERIMIDNFKWTDYSSTYSGTGNWTTLSNWSKGLPTSTMNVLISGTLTVDDVVECNNLTISTSGAVTVGAGQGLSVNGNFLIDSDATGTGSFIGASADYVVAGTSTVERFISNDATWHFLSSPNTGTMPLICDGNFAPTTGNFNSTTGATYDFFKWSEGTAVNGAVWNNLKTATWGVNTADFGNPPAFEAGKGYLVEYASGFAGSTTKTFTGTLSSESATISITANENTYNLVGNPFPASIDWKNAAWTSRSGILKQDGGGYNIWIWNQANGQYGAFNSAGSSGSNGATQYIAPTQGFFVQAVSAGTLTVPALARTHSNQEWLKATELAENLLKIEVTGNETNYSDEIVIEFGHTSNDGGSGKWWSLYADAPSLYTVKNDKNYSISFLTDITENQTVPVSFKAGVNGNYALTSTFDQSSFGSINLQDLKTGVIQDLKTNHVYTFTAETGDEPARFILKFGSVGVNDAQVTETGIYSYNNQICIQNPGKAILEVYNMAGQRILVEEINSNGLYQTSLNNQTGYYVVRLTNAGQVKVSKVFIR